MAYVRTHDTVERRNGKPIRTYAVVWREPVRDAFGLPTGKMRSRQETFPTRAGRSAVSAPQTAASVASGVQARDRSTG